METDSEESDKSRDSNNSGNSKAVSQESEYDYDEDDDENEYEADFTEYEIDKSVQPGENKEEVVCLFYSEEQNFQPFRHAENWKKRL